MRIWPLLGWLSKGLHPRVAATWAVGWGKGRCGVGVAGVQFHLSFALCECVCMYETAPMLSSNQSSEK